MPIVLPYLLQSERAGFGGRVFYETKQNKKQVAGKNVQLGLASGRALWVEKVILHR